MPKDPSAKVVSQLDQKEVAVAVAVAVAAAAKKEGSGSSSEKIDC